MSKKLCFIISPIGEEGSEVRKRADQVLRHVLAPAVNGCGYEPVRADTIAEPGLITSQIIQHIVDDPLVIADLTGMNPNVFYELAIRHAIRRPLVQVIQKGEKIPFDVAGMRTIPVDHRDLDSVEEAKGEIQKQIKAVESKKPADIDSPISVSVEIQSLRQSENPEKRSLAEFVSAVADLRSDIAAIEKRISSPERILPVEYLREVMPMLRRRSRDSEMIYRELTSYAREMIEAIPEKQREAVKPAFLRFDKLLCMLRDESSGYETGGGGRSIFG